jgi:hypothetical protein
MLIDWLAQKLYPRHSPGLRSKEMGMLALAIVTAVVVAASLGILMFYLNNKRHG